MTALTVAEWAKGQRGEKIRVSLDMFKGRPMIGLRIWWPDEDGELKPGKGLSVQTSHIRQLRDALDEAEKAAVAAGMPITLEVAT